ncbi:nucleocapsid protein [Cytorhabdovirus gramineae]|uniref:Nucleoprotein n=1 Tax=Northern cereal mosaic virus TaxID=1985704 RepID=NCAP_NCMV|nr:nucleocapsid protein [Cytorhabdovirus gramineae]Q9JGU1.1 RecName: Full=Nucleoprotein; Short=NP; AltName: Full=Nucleocapsid protein; Short=Protein N [Cytorhabdovirus gramineae]BAA95344.1 nucleocapsid protein [Cytorhabdovirus gramineae]
MANEHKSPLDKRVTDLFKDIPTDISTHLITGETFSNESFQAIPVYTLTNVTVKQAVHLSYKLFESMKTTKCAAGYQYAIYLLAQRLLTPAAGSNDLVFKDYIPQGGSDLPQEIKNKIYVTTELSDSQTAGKSEAEKKKATADLIFGDNTDHDLQQVRSQDDETIIRFGSFISAFLMKLIVKQQSNIVDGWNGMLERYTNFYGESPITAVPKPNADWLAGLKNYLISDPKIGHTWVRVISAAENALSVGDKSFQMVRYLASLPLSLTGMHAYKLFLEVQKQSNLGMQWLLEEMVSPKTLPALEGIAKILKNFESRTSTRKPPYFRYARIMSPAYFQELQTKNCPELVYLLVCLLQKYEAFGAGQEPTKIVGIERVPANIRAEMSRAAGYIFSVAPQRNMGMYSDSMRKALVHQEKASTSRAGKEKADEVFGM